MKNGKQEFHVHGAPPEVPRTYASKGYIMEIEPGMYGLFRDVLTETDKVGPDGNIQREKAGRIGPLALLRRAREGEPVVAQTFDTETNTVIYLTPIDPETGK